MFQSWRELLFAHWPIDADAIRRLVPEPLEVDTFDGRAWLGIVPFTMTGIRLRWLPPVPGVTAFHELNVRTYVTFEGKPGVWFFSLDAANAAAVSGARLWFRLPYFRARMSLANEPDRIRYSSVRTHPGAPAAELRARYGPLDDARPTRPGSLDEWLTERYCLYAADRHRIFRGEIDHPRWALQPAWAVIDVNTMAEASGIPLPDALPLLHFSRRQDVVVWGLERVG
jgi:uncharacterized protein YqjF (DUF2071 family)